MDRSFSIATWYALKSRILEGRKGKRKNRKALFRTVVQGALGQAGVGERHGLDGVRHGRFERAVTRAQRFAVGACDSFPLRILDGTATIISADGAAGLLAVASLTCDINACANNALFSVLPAFVPSLSGQTVVFHEKMAPVKAFPAPMVVQAMQRSSASHAACGNALFLKKVFCLRAQSLSWQMIVCHKKLMPKPGGVSARRSQPGCRCC
jgi:hypothetical protein